MSGVGFMVLGSGRTGVLGLRCTHRDPAQGLRRVTLATLMRGRE